MIRGHTMSRREEAPSPARRRALKMTAALVALAASGAARATSVAPIEPPAPPLFSTTNGCPSASWSLCAMERARMSVDPPGGKGTTRRTGRRGQSAAARTPPAASVTSAAATFSAQRRAAEGTRSPGDTFPCMFTFAPLSLDGRGQPARHPHRDFSAPVPWPRRSARSAAGPALLPRPAGSTSRAADRSVSWRRPSPRC